MKFPAYLTEIISGEMQNAADTVNADFHDGHGKRIERYRTWQIFRKICKYNKFYIWITFIQLDHFVIVDRNQIGRRVIKQTEIATNSRIFI